MTRRPSFKYNGTDELAQAIVSLACLIKNEAWLAQRKETKRMTSLELLQSSARVAMGDHAEGKFVHQILAYIADESAPSKPKLSIVRTRPNYADLRQRFGGEVT